MSVILASCALVTDEYQRDQKKVIAYLLEDLPIPEDSEILKEWEDLFDVHTVLENTKQEYEDKLAKARAKQPKAEW